MLVDFLLFDRRKHPVNDCPLPPADDFSMTGFRVKEGENEVIAD